MNVPDRIRQPWPEHKAVFDRYGKKLYAVYRPAGDQEATAIAVAAMLDVMFTERGQRFLKTGEDDAAALELRWFEHLMASTTRAEVSGLLCNRRYVVLQGPSGTGKTVMARGLPGAEYKGNGTSIQFHPNTTYESFAGGLSPAQGTGGSRLNSSRCCWSTSLKVTTPDSASRFGVIRSGWKVCKRPPGQASAPCPPKGEAGEHCGARRSLSGDPGPLRG